MAGGWPIGLGLANAVAYGINSSTGSASQSITSGTANHKGSWVELNGSPTTSDILWVLVTVDDSQFSAGTTESSCIDLGIGASGSQQVIISNLLNYGQVFSDSFDTVCSYFFPLAIPSGTHVWARSQTTGSNHDPVGVSFIGFDASFSNAPGGSCSCYDTYGFVSTSTEGTALTASGTVNVKGSYTEITASTTNDLMGFFLAFDSQGSASNVAVLTDLAIGASGSEVVILPNIPVWMSQLGVPMPQATPFISIPIQAGTRIAARCQSTKASQNIGVTLYGLRQ